MLWPAPRFCLYFTKKEHVVYCDDDYELTEEQIADDVIKMPSALAAICRRAKNLPMPSPPPPGGVVVSDGRYLALEDEGEQDG